MTLWCPTALVTAVLSVSACQPATLAATIQIETDERSAVTAVEEGGATVIDVISPAGIGWARIDPGSGGLPGGVRLRLRLTALEEVRVSYGDTTIVVSIGHEDGRIHQRVGRARNDPAGDRTIGRASPYWMNVTVLPDRRSGRLEGDGYFELELPADYGRAGRPAFGVRWIDRFR